MTIRTIHVGVGGRGVWPLRTMPARDDFQPVALVDINPEKLATAREMTGLGESVCFGDIAEALANVEADAVVVITPPDFHAKHCHQAVQAGKHVLVEKPFTKDLTMAHALVQQAEAKDLKIVVCQNKRYGGIYQTISRLIRDRVYGAPSYGLMTTFGWRPGTHHSGLDRHSYLWERGIHDLDTLCFMLNAEPTRIWGHSFNPSWSPYAGGAGVQAWVEFEGGISFGMLTTFASHGKGSTLRIECEEGTLEQIGGDLIVHRPGVDEPETVPLDAALPFDKTLLDSFYSYITEGIESEVSGPRNLRTIGLVEGIGVASDHGAVLDFDAFMESRTS